MIKRVRHARAIGSVKRRMAGLKKNESRVSREWSVRENGTVA
jgi:hypothetical protein